MEKDYSRNYRQYSYSETDLKDIKIAPKIITSNSINSLDSNNNIEVNNNLEVPDKKLKCKISGYYIFKRITKIKIKYYNYFIILNKNSSNFNNFTLTHA